MNIGLVNKILYEVTNPFRKGDYVTQRQDGPVKITEVFDMPPQAQMPEGIVSVDVHFITIGVDKAKAESYRADLIRELDTYERLRKGPSFIEVGAELGSQDAALRLLAVGQALGFWEVVTPTVLGLTGSNADNAAGMGLVMNSGYSPNR